MNQQAIPWIKNQRNSNNNHQSPYFTQYHRQWITTPYGINFKYDVRRGQAFRLMSYNILAQSCLTNHPELYANNIPQCLDWTHRLHCIRNEIFELKPHILCLQEVENSHLPEIQAALEPLNYAKPLYKKRTSDNYHDGCAIFYNSQLFQLINHHYVEYYQPDIKVLNRFNVAIIAKFASTRLRDLEFVVATTHLLFNPRREDVRTAQVQLILAELDRMSVHTRTQQPLPIIFAGDFNCLPFSMTWKLIQDGHINSQNLPLKLGIMDDCQHLSVTVHNNRQYTALYNSNIDDKQPKNGEKDCIDENNLTTELIHKTGVPYNTGSLWHHLNLTTTLPSNGIASTFQDKWILVDYIFYTRFGRRELGPIGKSPSFSSLQVLKNFTLPNIQNCHSMGPIPNLIYGSDHYSMATEFVLLKR